MTVTNTMIHHFRYVLLCEQDYNIDHTYNIDYCDVTFLHIYNYMHPNSYMTIVILCSAIDQLTSSQYLIAEKTHMRVTTFLGNSARLP